MERNTSDNCIILHLYNIMLANLQIIDRKRDDHDHDCVSLQKIGDIRLSESFALRLDVEQ